MVAISLDKLLVLQERDSKRLGFEQQLKAVSGGVKLITCKYGAGAGEGSMRPAILCRLSDLKAICE